MINAAGKAGQNQISASTKKPSQQPNTNSGTNSQSVTPTQNPSKPNQQNEPTGQVTDAAGNGGQNQVNASTKKPSQQRNTNSGTNSQSVTPTQTRLNLHNETSQRVK